MFPTSSWSLLRPSSLACLVVASSASAQWASLSRDPGSEIHTQAFHVLATAGSRVHAFSAMHPSWLDLGAPHTASTAPAVRTGDWTGLVRLSANLYRAYSARLHQYADVAFVENPDQLQVCVQDDIILIIGTRVGGTELEACAYSAQTNAWDFVLLTGGFRQFACSRFVAGVIRGDRAFGFSARRGRWVLTPCGTTASLLADGNVLVCNDGPPTAVLAFSGVRGSWVASPSQHTTSTLAIDHNVAFLRADGGMLGARRCAYSAYNGEWVIGSPVSPPATVRLTDNLVLFEQLGTPFAPPSVAAFGARPGAWSTLALPRGVTFTVTAAPDWAIVNDQTSRMLHAVSGVLSGTWSAQASSGAAAFTAFAHSTVTNEGSVTRAFAAPGSVFADPVTLGSGLLVATNGGAGFYNATDRWAFSARHGQWVAGPIRGAGTHTFLTAQAFVADYSHSTGQLALWHERRNLWTTLPVSTGGPLTAYSGGTNLLLLDLTGIGQGVVGVSGQRGDAAPATGIVAPLLERRADENVGWVRDGADVLHAFASPNATYSFFQYPLDSEFQILADRVVAPSKTMVRGEPDAAAYLVVGLPIPPVPIASIGTLYCSPLVVPFAGTLDGRGLLPSPYELPITGAGAIEICLQGITVGASGVRLIGSAGEPSRYQ